MRRSDEIKHYKEMARSALRCSLLGLAFTIFFTVVALQGGAEYLAKYPSTGSSVGIMGGLTVLSFGMWVRFSGKHKDLISGED